MLGGLDLLQDQLAGLEEAAEQKLQPQLNYKSVPAVQSSNLGYRVSVAWPALKSTNSLPFPSFFILDKQVALDLF